jgi:hypothetical protein
MRATVHIDELNPETRAKVLEQISGTETGTNAPAISPAVQKYIETAKTHQDTIDT